MKDATGHYCMSPDSAGIIANYRRPGIGRPYDGDHCQMELIRRHAPDMTPTDKARAAYTLAYLGRKVQGHHPIWEYRP